MVVVVVMSHEDFGSEEEFTEFAEATNEAPLSSSQIFFQSDENSYSQVGFAVPEYLQSLLQVESDSLRLVKSFSSLDATERKDLFQWLMKEGNPFEQETQTDGETFSSLVHMPDDDIFPTTAAWNHDTTTRTEQYYTQVFQNFVQKQVVELRDTPQPPDSLTIHLASALDTPKDSLQAVEVELPKEIAHIKERLTKIPLPSLYGRNVNKGYLNPTSISEMLAAQRATSQVLEDLDSKEEVGVNESDLENIPSPRNWQLFVPSNDESSESSYSEETNPVASSKPTEGNHPKEELYEIDLG